MEFSVRQANEAVGQRRYVTMLFSDISGSSELAERLDAEDFSELLDAFRKVARDTLERHGGHVARMQGDGLLATFGYPCPNEDDGRRATEAALDLHAAAAALDVGLTGFKLQVHSGIHAGLVLVTDGDVELGRFDLVGDAPNTAARLCSLAAAGEICVSEETLGPQAQFFESTLPQILQIRGRTLPLAVLRVNGRSGRRRRFEADVTRGQAPFFGREAVLQALNEALARAVPNIPAGLRLAGEPGIGKSRLLEQFQAQLDGTTHLVLSAYCEHYLGAQPLQPFEQLIRASRLCQQLEPHGVASTNELASSGVPRIDTCLELLANVARRRTLVLILDDWQWADDLSRLALNYLFKQRLSVFVVLAARTDADIDIGIEANTHHLPSIHLEPFTAAAAQQVITCLLPGADPFITQQIDKLAGGSPLFIEELCHSVAAEGGQRAFEAVGSQAVWINSLVVSRVARLPPLLAELLRVAAVAGNVFPAWLFERLTGLGAEAQALQELTARDFLYPVQQSGLLRFKHALTRDAVYGTVSRKQRRDLHLRVAGELAAAHGGEDDADEALAYHYRAAGDLGNAARFAEAAGDKALTANALDRARAQYTASLQALDEMNPRPRELPRQWCRVAQKLGMACVFDPLNLEDGLALFERAVILSRETGEHDVMARAEYWLAYIYYAKGLPRLAATHCQFALDWNASTGDARLAAQINATLGQVHVAAGEYARALPLLDQAVQSKRVQSKPGNAVAIGSAYTLARKAFMLGDLGQFSDANACFEESLVLLGDAAHPVAASVQSLISVVKLWQGCWRDALSAATAGIEISTQSRSRYLLAMGRSFAACAAWMLRPDAAVLAALREPTLWIESRGGAISTSLNYGWLVEIATALGEHQEARRHGARLLLRARLLDRLGEATGCRAMAAQAARCGDARRSEAYLERADRAAALRGSPREAALNQMVRAEIALSRRQHDAAEPWLDAAGEAFTRLQMSWHLQRLTQLRAG